jgi:signal transduction histidine kinase
VELAAINAIGIVLGSTRELEHLVRAGLTEITARLGFERGLVALLDPAAQELQGIRLVGGLPGGEALLADLAIPLGDAASHLAQAARAESPLRFREVHADPAEPNRRIAAVMGVTSYVGTPLVAQGRTIGVLLVHDRRDGRELEPADGPLLYTVGTLYAGAIESARLYETLEEQNRALEARVAERTHELVVAMSEAQEARAAAESANEAKSRFLANISHELRTPLTSVVGFAKLNRKRLDDVVFPVVPREDPKVERAVRQVGENLGIIVSEGDRLTGLINDLLDLAKIEAGRMEWRLAPVAVEDVVRQALAATAALFEVSGLALTVDVEPGLPIITGDRDRLVQVVINLVSNAVKFTGEGGVACRVHRDEDAIRVAVTDTGRGIAPGDRARVFEPFRHASDTVPEGPRGTGLGLPISKQIVEGHGGSMGLDSEVGRGSTFWFRLPVVPPGADAEPA